MRSPKREEGVSNRPWRSPFGHLFDAFFGDDSRLPDGVEADKIEAQFKNGVLAIHLPKKEEAKKVVRQVQVKAG